MFNKEKWDLLDIEEFNNYLFEIRNENKIDWTKNIVNTNMEVLAIKSDVIKNIAKDICKGNFISFLDICDFKYYEATLVYGKVLSKIKDKELFIKYLDKLIYMADNWASIDTIDFSIALKNEDYFYDKALYYLNSEYEFVKRCGIRILFKYVNEKYLDKLIGVINNIDTKYYYVAMGVAWLLCECATKYEEYIVKNISKIKVDNITFRKFVSKCNDSYRISNDTKLYLRSVLNER